MKTLKTYKLLNMYFAYNTKTNNYFLVRHYEYSNFFSKKYIKVYSEYKELSHLIYAFNDIMEKEFLLNKDYFKSSLIFSKIIETNNNLKEINELEIIKTAFNSLKGIFSDKYIIVDLKLVKTSAVALKLKELINLYLIHKKEDIKSVLSFENNYYRFYKKFGYNSRFTFIEYDNRGHNYLYYTDEARSYGKKLSEDFTSFKKSLQVEITPEIRAEYFKKHLDKKQFFEVDKGLMEKIVSFYDES